MTKKIFQWLGLLLAWLTISPVFFFLSRRWELLPKGARWVLMLVSPMFLIGYIIALLTFLFYNPFAGRYTDQFKDRETLTEITCVEFPEFKVIKHHKGEVAFNGDFCDEIEAVFVVEPDETFYKSIEKQSVIEDAEGIEGDYSSWNVYGDEYNYSRMWGNGFKAPKGQNDEDDVFLEIHIAKGKKKFQIKCGMW